ncbi:unannotated protein [freshwater metagenome]|uniref:Unannotated protein n=1 Tax=freshwater metagenome TaxID=449393 RepID=A0A6J6J893_9ZZZZ
MSVDTSSKASSAAIVSPTFFNHRVTVPSLTLSPSAGIVITVPALDAVAAGAVATGAGVEIGAATGEETTGAATGATGVEGAAGVETTGAAAPSAITANSAPTGTV